MITLPYQRDEDKVVDAVLSREGFSVKTILLLDGEDLSERLEFEEEGTWGQSEIPISLDFTIAGVLGRRLEDAKCELFVDIEGVLVPQMIGYRTTPLPGGDGGDASDKVQSGLMSASAGSLLPRTTLNAFTEYPGRSPEYVVRNVVYRVGLYNRGLVRIDPLSFPILEFTGQAGFVSEETCMDVLSRLVGDNEQAQVPYIFRDTAYGGFVASVNKGVGGEDYIRTYSASDIPDWVPPARTSEKYSSVVVFRENPERTHDTPIDERYAIFEESEINYNRPVRPAFANTTLYIPFEDVSADGPAKARALAYERAGIIGRGVYGGTITLPAFDPLIERQDSYRIDEAHRDDDGFWDRAWLIQVDGYQHTFDGSGIGTQVTYTAALVQEDIIRAPAFINPSALDFSQIGKSLYGEAGDELYFEDEFESVTTIGDELEFAEDFREVYEDGEELVVLMPTPAPRGLSTGVIKTDYGNEDGELYFSLSTPFAEKVGDEIILYEAQELYAAGDEVVIR